SPQSLRELGPHLAAVPISHLTSVGDALDFIRQSTAAEATHKVDAIREAYLRAQPTSMAYPIDQVAALRWGAASNLPEFSDLYALAVDSASSPVAKFADPVAVVSSFLSAVACDAAQTSAIAAALKERFDRQIEPVGTLHLERIEMTPVGIEH